MSDTEHMTNNPLFRYNYKEIDEDTIIVDRADQIIEACYDLECAKALHEITKIEYSDDSIEFITDTNHLFLTKAGMSSRLKSIVKIDTNGGLAKGISALFERYISNNGSRQVNLSSGNRRKLTKMQHVITASHDVKALIRARDVCGGLAAVAIQNFVKSRKVMPKLKEVLESDSTPTNAEVLRRLNQQDTNVSDFLANVGTRSRSNQ